MRAPCSRLGMDLCWIIGFFVPILLESEVVKGQEHRHLAVECASDWTPYDKNCYRLYTSTKSWTEAFIACQSVGSILVDIESASEQTFLQNFVSGGPSVWIGASDSATEGQWRWYSSPQSWVFINWDSGEPNDFQNEDCIEFRSSGKWNDLPCDRKLAYVCKQSNMLSFCDSTWSTRNGHCYKRFPSKVIWSEALETCQANSGYLASIEDSGEMSYVNGIFDGDNFWIGGFDIMQEGTYIWSGTTLSWSYTHWRIGQPDNVTNHDCVSVFRGLSTWEDSDCNLINQFMCQRNTFHLHEDPVLEMTVNETTEEIGFLCFFTSNFSDVEYSIRWYINNNMVQEEIYTDERESYLEESKIGQLLYEDQIKCSVTPCMPGNCSAMKGSSRDSEAFIAKVQVVGETHITTYERSGPVYINVTSTVPPRLFYDKAHQNNQCNVTVFAELVKEKETKCPGSRTPVSQVVFGVNTFHNKPCYYPITMDTWNTGILIPVKASVDSLKDRDQTRNIQLYVTTPNTTKQFSTVKVTVVDENKIAVCSSINDPHMTTFDRMYYDNYLEGEFILYRHKSLSYEVRTFYRKCDTRASCNCAIAVRSGDDVILVDVCGPTMGKSPKQTPYTIKMYLNGDLTPGTEVIRRFGGKTYEIILPTGAKVIVMNGWVILGRRFLNVKVVASTLDYNNTEGLCGTFDGNRTNDFTKRDGTVYVKDGKQPNEFSLSWRVSEDESLYRGYCVTTDGSSKIERYCDCMEGETTMCQEGMDLMSCVEIEKRRGLLDAQRGRKRVTVDLIRDAESPPTRCEFISPPEQFQHEPEYRQPDPQWPTPSNTTEDIAVKFCQDFMEAKESGKQCTNLTGFDLAPILQGCISDIQLTDGTDWAKESLDNLLQECTTIVESDTEKWTVDNKTGDTFPPPGIVGSICPNSCAENGNCTGGFCVCAEPWIGDDCSVNRTAPPELYQVGTGEPCDSICSNCTLVQLYGENFADVENLTCHYKSHNVTLGSASEVTTSKAEFFNSQTAKCLISVNGVYEVAISNDGETTSVYKIYISYNSYCDRCNETGCRRRNDMCEIGGNCFVSGFFNPSNVSEVCDITRSKSQWSTLQVENIETRSYIFQNISGQTLITKKHSVSIGGTGTPTLITGLSGEKAVVLDGNQYISLGDLTGACFGDVEKSTFGITITFNVKLTANISNCYVFSNGGEEVSNYGYVMWFRNDKLHASVSNSENEWAVSTSVEVEKFIHVEMSWSLQNGLQLNIDENVNVSSKKCFLRPASNYTVFKDFVIGGSSKKDGNCQMAIESFAFVCAFTDIINSTGFIIREPTTTVPPFVPQCKEASLLRTDAAIISISVVAGSLFSAVIFI
ncbi:uncharacterized protein LOC130050218 isoform X3 [Ostrea edulis]|uniref:uncharacterized protein LOC130050218 isoform X3 n=1 Tax=Ostrea edulis TaxID=37623 RepID=UPI0024AF8DD4|nr:uncharacterized protein LOC130050218 isoform X3 [Ostrea edulis]